MLFTMCVASNDSRELNNFSELRLRAQALGPQRVGVVAAEDEVALTAADAALQLGIAIPVLIGDERKTRMMVETLELCAIAKTEFVDADNAALVAARMARDNLVDLLLKGHLRTDQLLRAVLDNKAELRSGRLLSDVFLYEDRLAGNLRLVGITDGGLNVSPSLEQKKQIVQNAIEVMRALGLGRPKIAIMSATEAVSASVPSTVDAKALTEMGDAGQLVMQSFRPGCARLRIVGVGGSGQGHCAPGGWSRGLHGGSQSRGGQPPGQIREVPGRIGVRSRSCRREGTNPDSFSRGECRRQAELDCLGGYLCDPRRLGFSPLAPGPRPRSWAVRGRAS